MRQPANVRQVTQQIIDAGIAHRMLVENHRPHLPSSPSECLFWVEVDTDISGAEITSVVVQYPPSNRTQAFEAMPDRPFGIAGQLPLNAEQQKLVNRLADTFKHADANQA